MNTLVIAPFRNILNYSFYESGRRLPASGGETQFHFHSDDDIDAIKSGITEKPELIALRALFGGAEFEAPAIVSQDVVDKLESLVSQAPLHTPRLLSLIHSCRRIFKDTPIALVFETSFFTRLPEREYSYGLDPELMKRLNLRRYGYHGILHEAAGIAAAARLRKKTGEDIIPNIISICLQPKPEIAAVKGRRPVMITSGATPLEGIPGRTSCGDLDPSVVLTLAEKKGWGPEQIDDVLTHKSGLVGLVGRDATLETVVESTDEKNRLARELIRERILMACGAAMAALGRADMLVFSGQRCGLGEMLGPWLSERLAFKHATSNPGPAWFCYDEPENRIIADMAQAAFRRQAVAVNSL